MDDTDFSATVLVKLPLADSVWRLLHFMMDESWLDDLWDRTRGRCHERILQFPTLAHLVAEALLQHGGSGRQAFDRGQEDGRLPVSIGSAFEKLGNLPLALSEAFLEEGTHRLQAILPDDPAIEPLANCWAGHEVFAIDGKAIKHVKRLLKQLRNLQAGILGARAAVALNLRTGMAMAMRGHLDGEAGEAALAEKLLPKLTGVAGERPWVVVLDRLYCNLTFPPQVLKAGGHFVIRYDPHTSFNADATKPAQEFRDDEGRRVVKEWGWLGKANDHRCLYVRRLTLWVPDGKQVIVITDLLDEQKYPALDLLAMYQKRWGIEKVFHQITEVFSLKKLIGTTPQAALFQLSFCLLLYNTLQVVRAHLASHQKCEGERISNEKLFYDVKRQLVATNELVEVEELPALLGKVPTASDLRAHLRDRLQDTWSRRWWKAGSSRGGGHQKVKTRVLGNHTLTYRVLQQQRERDERTPKPPRGP